jgi:16S rRNA (guanine527-N7)-methyltransferase
MAVKSSNTSKFTQALVRHAPRYGVLLNETIITDLGTYYETLMAWNERLHLVAPCSPAEFATRHILESLFALSHIAPGAMVIDLGSGGGLPAIPSLIARPDIQSVLFESSKKKAIFLREALEHIGARQRAVVMDERFEHRSTPRASVVMCRAIERFAEILPTIYYWSPPGSRLLLFGGSAIQKRLQDSNVRYYMLPIPESERRYLFIVEKKPQV